MIEIIVDTVQAMDSNRIPIVEYRELVTTHNCNLSNSEDAEDYFNTEDEDNLTVMSDAEWFDTFFSFEVI